MSNGILRSIKVKDKQYILLKSTPINDHNYAGRKKIFQTYSKILKSTIRKAKSNYYHSQFQLFKNDMRKTWTTINELLNKNKKKTEFPDKFLIGDELISDKSLIVNKLNQYFVEIGATFADKIYI